MSSRSVAAAALIGLSLVAGAARAASAGSPEAAIRITIDEAFAVLKDPSLAGKAQRARRIAALRQIADRTFDWSEMARSSLGVAWRSLDGTQRARFVEVFESILAARYMDDIDRFQGRETVTIDGTAPEGDTVTVRTTLVTASRERVPIDYRMRLRGESWSVVDLTIENVSLVNHFRKTFAAALANMTVDQLIERLKRQLPATEAR